MIVFLFETKKMNKTIKYNHNYENDLCEEDEVKRDEL